MTDLIKANKDIVGIEFLDELDGVLNSIKKKHLDVSNIETPKSFIQKKMGLDYVSFQYMKTQVNKHFPGWSWEIIKSEALGSDAYVVHGRLKWLDNGIMRTGDMVASHRIQKKKGTDEFVDIGNDIKSANSDCMKKAFNVYMEISSDVYKTQDPELSDEQINELMDIVKGTKYEGPTKDSIEAMTTNAENFKAVKARAERLIKSDSDNSSK